MAFTSYIFLFIFFPLCVIGYLIVYMIQSKWKGAPGWLCDLFLIGAGLGFYGWSRVDGILFLCIYIGFVYIVGKYIQKTKTAAGGRMVVTGMTVILLLLLGLLYFYKYVDFTLETVNRIFGMEFEPIAVMVPLGISFLTFSAVSYVVDIYRGDCEAGNILETALFLTFFPKLVSGPLVMWKEFQPQIKSRMIDERSFLDGLNRIMIGYAKKVILADTFGVVVGDIQYKMEAGIDMPTAWLCALLYMLQIYYDFAGYSDIAIGLAKLFGFRIRENFCFPYISASISEFWRRWHISLGTWFREYLYIPLGGNKKGNIRTLWNLFLVFLATGIWHGAGWNYIAWGMLNGFCVILERCIRAKKFYCRIPYAIKWSITMFIVLISWELFRLPGIRDILDFLAVMFGIKRFDFINFTYEYFYTPKIMVLIFIAVLGATLPHKNICQNLYRKVNESPFLLVCQEFILFGLMVLTVMFMVNSTYSPFIYFQY